MTTKIFRALMLMAVAAALVAPSTLSANEGRKIKREVKPSYPQLAKQMHVSGAVKLQVIVAPSGKVKSVTALGGHPLLIAPSEQAAKDWEYEPAGSETTELVVFNFSPSE